jgi:4-amino-4-deoxy-L-arabinose transferase-like glycosyltransferase
MDDPDGVDVANYEVELARRRVRQRRALVSSGVLAIVAALVLPQLAPSVEPVMSFLAIGGALCFVAAKRVGSSAPAD